MTAYAPTTAGTAAPTTSPTADEFRHHLGHFATGVTVVTARDAQGPVGFACQSFSAVSLDPPLVLFCVGRESRSWPRIRRSGVFCVNVLGEGQQELCNRFGSSRGTKFDGLDWEESPWSTPSLPGVLVRVHAELTEVHEGGDHDIAIGRVRGLESVRPGRPLVFYRGGFGLDADGGFARP